MAKTSLAHPAHQSTRELRGLALYREYGHDIEPLGGDIYLVPSQDGSKAYRVQYGEHEFCSCPDHQHRDVTCAHIYAVGISLAKRRARRSLPCAACGSRFPRKALADVLEDTGPPFWRVNASAGLADALTRFCSEVDTCGAGARRPHLPRRPLRLPRLSGSPGEGTTGRLKHYPGPAENQKDYPNERLTSSFSGREKHG